MSAPGPSIPGVPGSPSPPLPPLLAQFQLEVPSSPLPAWPPPLLGRPLSPFPPLAMFPSPPLPPLDVPLLHVFEIRAAPFTVSAEHALPPLAPSDPLAAGDEEASLPAAPSLPVPAVMAALVT